MAIDDTYPWDLASAPPPIGDHSLAKHEVLEQYLCRYVEVVTANVAKDHLKITLVDAFSGGGMYTKSTGELHMGSPLRMIHAMKAAEIAANGRREKPFRLDVAFLFLDKNPATLEYLRKTVREDRFGHEYLSQDKVEFIAGSFDEKFESIMKFIDSRKGKRRSIFLLDQYGYTDVPLPLLREIFTRFEKAEVMLTFMTDWLLDFFSGKNQLTRELLGRMNLHHLQREFEVLINEKQRHTHEWRRAAQSLLYKDLCEGSGASFFTPFFIRTADAHKDYWFVHLSGHERARDEMAKLHWSIQNRFIHYGKAGFSMLGYDPGEDPRCTRQPEFNFGDADRQASQDLLMMEIPKRIEEFGGGISFASFFRRVCNDTPSTEGYMKDVISTLSIEGDLEIVSSAGTKRLPGVKIKGTDIIRLPQQTRLFNRKF